MARDPVADRRVFRLSFQNAKESSGGKAATQLTGDHPVLTERGYVPAAELRPTDRVATGQGLSSWPATWFAARCSATARSARDRAS